VVQLVVPPSTTLGFFKPVAALFSAFTRTSPTAHSSLNRGENIVHNPSIEFRVRGTATSSEPDGWFTDRHGINSATFTYPVVGHDSPSTVQVSISSYESGDAKWYFAPLAVKEGGTYIFSDYYQANTSTYLTAQFESISGTMSYMDIAKLGPAANWQRAEGVFAVPPGTKSVTVFHILKSVGQLTIDDVALQSVPGAFEEGMVSINFDDGWTSQHTNALPILEAANLSASFYIITQVLGKGGYMTESQVRDIAARGHDIGAHTRTHPHLPQISREQMEDEIVGSKSDLEAMGISIATFAYPYGEFNDDAEEIVRSNFRGARIVQEGLNTRSTDAYLLRTESLERTTSIEQIRQWVDSAIANNAWLILSFHQVDPASEDQYAVTPNMLQDIVDYLAETSVPVVTTSEGLGRQGNLNE
jgi:peptidoglycan/xylan/chitin deacetylase (PgdA/CDA1 family)